MGGVRYKIHKVSVIVPVYGVERFIVRCVRSLMNQTLDDVEFIFVDDATPDESIRMLQHTLDEYPQRNGQVKVIHHEKNQGLPAARNTGLSHATGEYIFHCDSDDYLDADALEVLYETARMQGADIVWCDWFLTFERNERYMRQPCFHTSMEALAAMLGGGMKYNVWNKLVRRSLYTDNKIDFPSGYGMGEDMTMILLFACAAKVAYVPRAFYHYVKTNANSFCQTYSVQHLRELRHNVQRTVSFLEQNLPGVLDRELSFMKLAAKYPFLISDGSNGKYRIWESWYPEANRYVMQNKYVSFRSRLLQWCAWKKQWWLVWCHYQLVIRFMYGIIYR